MEQNQNQINSLYEIRNSIQQIITKHMLILETLTNYENKKTYTNINKQNGIKKLIGYHIWILEVLNDTQTKISMSINNEEIEEIRSLCKG